MSALLSGFIIRPQDDKDEMSGRYGGPGRPGGSARPLRLRQRAQRARAGRQVEVTAVASLSYQINRAGVEAA